MYARASNAAFVSQATGPAPAVARALLMACSTWSEAGVGAERMPCQLLTEVGFEPLPILLVVVAVRHVVQSGGRIFF